MRVSQPEALRQRAKTLSVIIPTYNESESILNLIEAVKDNLPHTIFTEIIVVDDNSPDGTGRIMDNYIQNTGIDQTRRLSLQKLREEKFDNNDDNNNNQNSLVKVVHRQIKSGLISAILQGIRSSMGQNILVMDADFSHPPETIPRLIDELLRNPNSIVVASRYINGGSIEGWPYKRRLLSSGAVKIARHSLKMDDVKDPMSGFFAIPRDVIENIKIDSMGYKILLEILVKVKGSVKVKEIPYTFINRKSGQSKLDLNVILSYNKAVWHLYRYGRKSKRITANKQQEKRRSVLFLSKAARFYTVGASGLLLNYLVSIILSNGILNFWYMQATVIGIIFSITSNFFLNKIWTFEDRDFSVRNTVKQFSLFTGISAVGAAIQLTLVYLFVEYGFPYSVSLVSAVAIASVGNFLFNKKWTFHEKIWG